MTLDEKFAELREKGEKALGLFVTVGDPSLEDLPGVLAALEEGGADFIEVGLPFSDPIADGPTIQSSSQRALESGVTIRSALDALVSVPKHVPYVAMGYYNPALRMGLDAFATSLRSSGVGACIVSDLTPEESTPWLAAARPHAIDTVFLAAPTSTDARLDAICAASRGFVYAVSKTGVTGTAARRGESGLELVSRLKAKTDLPVCLGFGISTPEQVREACGVADGAVVGSWLVDKLNREWKGGNGAAQVIAAIRDLKQATKC